MDQNTETGMAISITVEICSREVQGGVARAPTLCCLCNTGCRAAQVQNQPDLAIRLRHTDIAIDDFWGDVPEVEETGLVPRPTHRCVLALGCPVDYGQSVQLLLCGGNLLERAGIL